MFEYINPGVIIISLILIVPLTVTYFSKERFGIFNTIVLIAIIALNVYPPYHTYKSVIDNKALFIKGKTLTCSNTLFRYKINNKSWGIENDYFIQTKDSLMIRADQCTQ